MTARPLPRPPRSGRRLSAGAGGSGASGDRLRSPRGASGAGGAGGDRIAPPQFERGADLAERAWAASGVGSEGRRRPPPQLGSGLAATIPAI